MGLPTHKRKQSGSWSPFHSSRQWREAGHLEQDKRPNHAIRATPTVEATRAASVSSRATADIFLQHYVHFRNKFIFTGLSPSGIHKLFQTPDKSSSFQKKWDSKGVELTDKQLLQPRNFFNVEEGRGDSLVRGPSWMYFGTDCTLSIFPFPVHRQRCEMPGGKPNMLRGKWEQKSFVSIAALIGTKLLPFKYSRLSLLWLFAWVLPSGSPIHFDIKT